MPNLFIDIQARFAQFQDALDGLNRKADKAIGGIEKSVGRLTGAFAALGVGLSVAGLVALVKSSVDSVAALDDLSEKTSLTVETLASLREVAIIGGHSLEEVAGGASKFAKSVSAALGGSKEMLRLFQQLGISAEDLRKQSFDEIFVRFATVIANATDKTNALAIAQKLAGKGAAENLPFFNDLAERGLRAAKVTAEMAAQAERVQKSFKELALRSQETRDALVGQLLPGLIRVSDVMRQAAENGDNLLVVMAKTAKAVFFGDEQLRADKKFADAVNDQLRIERELGEVRKQAAVTGQAYAQEKTRRLEAELKATNELIAKLQQERKVREEANKPLPKPEGRTVGPVADVQERDKAIKQAEELKKLFEEVQRAGAAIDVAVFFPKGMEFEKAKDFLEKTKKLVQESTKDWIAHADAIFADAEAQDKALAVGESHHQTMEKVAERIKGLVDPTYEATKALEQFNQAIGFNGITEADVRLASLDERIRALLKPTENLFQAIQRAWEENRLTNEEMQIAFQGALDKIDLAKEKSNDFGHAISTAFEDAVVEGKKFSDVLKGLATDIAKIFFRKSVTKPLEDAIGGFDFTSLIRNLFNPSGTPQIPADVAPSVPYYGPAASGIEYVPRDGFAFLHRGETVRPASEDWGGGVSITQNIAVDSRSDLQSVRQAMAVARSQSVVAVEDVQRRTTRRR